MPKNEQEPSVFVSSVCLQCGHEVEYDPPLTEEDLNFCTFEGTAGLCTKCEAN